MLFASAGALLDLSNAGLNANSPQIGYHNLVTEDTIASDSEQSGYPITNLANPLTNSIWKSDSTSDQYITLADITYLGDINYIGIARHNLGSLGASLTVEAKWDEGGWTEIHGPILPGNDATLMLQFEGRSYSDLRLKISSVSGKPQIAVMYIGELLTLQRRIYVDHTPITMGRNTEFVNNVSIRGEFLGRVVLGETLQSAVNIKNLTPTWFRNYMDPFIVHAQTLPWFFAWRPSTYPDEVGFCWTTNSPAGKNQLSNGMMMVDLQFAGLYS